MWKMKTFRVLFRPSGWRDGEEQIKITLAYESRWIIFFLYSFFNSGFFYIFFFLLFCAEQTGIQFGVKWINCKLILWVMPHCLEYLSQSWEECARNIVESGLEMSFFFFLFVRFFFFFCLFDLVIWLVLNFIFIQN